MGTRTSDGTEMLLSSRPFRRPGADFKVYKTLPAAKLDALAGTRPSNTAMSLSWAQNSCSRVTEVRWSRIQTVCLNGERIHVKT